MNKAELKKKLSERSPLVSPRPVITPVDLYDVPKNKQPQEDDDREKSHNRTFAQSHSHTIVRVNRGYRLREDIIKDMKNVAITSNKKLYEVMEDAMLDYLKKNRH